MRSFYLSFYLAHRAREGGGWTTVISARYGLLLKIIMYNRSAASHSVAQVQNNNIIMKNVEKIEHDHPKSKNEGIRIAGYSHLRLHKHKKMQ